MTLLFAARLTIVGDSHVYYLIELSDGTYKHSHSETSYSLST
jgi:hypothetical protein